MIISQQAKQVIMINQQQAKHALIISQQAKHVLKLHLHLIDFWQPPEKII